MIRLKKFSFSLKDLNEENDSFEIPDEVENGIRKRWTPINVESDPEIGTVWVWAYLID